MRLTRGHSLHVSGELAAHVVVVGADVVETPVGQLIRTVELWMVQKNILLAQGLYIAAPGPWSSISGQCPHMLCINKGLTL